MKLYTPNAEERAFLYQEAQDLEGLLRHLGSLSVVIEERAEDFCVTFLVAPESLGMRVCATHRNLFDAAIAAKAEAARRLNLVVNALPTDQTPSTLLH